SLSKDAPFLPRGGYDMLWRKNRQKTAENEDFDIEHFIDSTSETPLLDMARTASLSDVADLLWTLVDEEAGEDGDGSKISAQEIAQLAERALEFCHSAEGERWLQGVKSDDEILEKLSSLLQSSSEQTQSSPRKKGVGSLLKTAGKRLKTRLEKSRVAVRE